MRFHLNEIFFKERERERRNNKHKINRREKIIKETIRNFQLNRKA